MESCNAFDERKKKKFLLCRVGNLAHEITLFNEFISLLKTIFYYLTIALIFIVRHFYVPKILNNNAITDNKLQL